MAESYRRRALMGIFGENGEPTGGDQRPGPVGGGMELPPLMPPPVAAPPQAGIKPNLGADPTGFTEGMAQRGGGTGGVGSGAAKGAMMGAKFGPYGALAGAVGGGIYGAVTKKAATAPTDYSVADATTAITNALTTYNGRPPAPGEVDAILAGQGLKPGDRYVGADNLNKVLSQLQTNAKNAPPMPAATAAPAAVAAPRSAASPGAHDGSILGFNLDKLNNPAHQDTKYTPAVRAFSGGLKAGVPLSRNNLDPMVAHARANGFPNARVAGGDLIDFGDGNGPIDVIGSDESIRFQNTTDNAQWEATHGRKAASTAGSGALGGNPFGGEALDDALNGDPLAAIRAAIAKFSGSSRPNAAALLNQLGGG